MGNGTGVVAEQGPPYFRRGRFALLIGLHLVGVLGPLATGVSVAALVLCAALYGLQMFGVTGGYHRYFAHRTFETGRVVRLVLAFLSLSTLQGRVLWWAAKHRDHHRFSDTEADSHSPVVYGLVRSHITWPFHTERELTVAHVNDLERFPEIERLDRLWAMPFIALAVASYALLGWQGVVVGLVWSTLLVIHATGAINSLAHTWGWRRYRTGDASRNNALLALATFGEGWHNNHHHYPSSCRQGFFWWELDLTWLALRALAATGLVWGLREPPAAVRAAVGSPRR